MQKDKEAAARGEGRRGQERTDGGNRELDSRMRRAAYLVALGFTGKRVSETVEVARQTVSVWKTLPAFQAQVKIEEENLRKRAEGGLPEKVSAALDFLDELTRGVLPMPAGHKPYLLDDAKLRQRAAEVILNYSTRSLRGRSRVPESGENVQGRASVSGSEAGSEGAGDPKP